MNEIKKKKWKLNKMEWKVAISISLFYFVSSISSSHMSSFFPLVAMKKNMDATVTGLVLASYPLVTILASPLIGLWMPTVGVRFTLIAGSFLEGGTQILFGFVAEMPNYNTFVVFCFVIRCIGSLGSSMSQTAAIAIISVTFKDNLTKIIGITELFYGVGLMIGPVIGGGLFEVGNFRLPFFVIGSATLATLPCFFFLIPEKIVYKSEIVLVLNQKSVSLLQLMLVPGVLVIALVAICTQIGYAFVDPTLPKHLEDVTNNTLSSSQIGLCFLLWSVLYTGLTPILGLYSDKKFRGRYAIIAGNVLMVIGYLLIGPAEFLTGIIPRKLYVVLIGLSITGAAGAPMLIPCLADMHTSVKNAGICESVLTASLISGIFNCCHSIGSVIGPILGGFLASRYSFSTSSVIMALMLAVLCLIVSLFTFWENSKRKPKKEQSNVVAEIETPV